MEGWDRLGDTGLRSRKWTFAMFRMMLMEKCGKNRGGRKEISL